MGLNNKKRNYKKFLFLQNQTNRTDMNLIEQQQQQAGLLKGGNMPTKINYQMFLNKNQDDEMELCCYQINKFKTFLTYLFILLTCGVLRLIFHWIPHWYIYATCRPCHVNEAEKILITEYYQGKHKIYHVKKMKILTPEKIQKIKDETNLLNSNQFDKDFVAYLNVHFGNGVFREVDKLWFFQCKKVTYIWDVEKQEFTKLHGLDQGVTFDILHNSKGLTYNEQFVRQLVYGPNKIIVKELSILTLLFLEVLNPFYIFQTASFILWFLDDYYYYAAAILIMSIFGISMTITQIRKNQRKLKSTVHSSDVCTVLRKTVKKFNETGTDLLYKSEVISTELLVPGDVLEIPTHGCVMHCDAVLLTGTCIVNESMLTGESVPVTKTAIPNLNNIIYDPKEHARHTLFCGTRVIQTRYFGNEKVLAIVLRTGFSTAKGSLIRSILYPPPVDFRFEKDSYRFVILLACVACIGFIYTVITKLMRGIPPADLVIEALDLITIVVPPALPAAMTVGQVNAQIRLRKKEIFCISSRAINVSGSIDCVCFDKTGTLTEDGLDLLCVVPVVEKSFENPITSVETLPYNTLLCGLVSCHSLTIIDKQIVGDPLDLKMFESTKWTMEEHDIADNNKFNMLFPTVLKPPKNRPLITIENCENENEQLQIGIIREFPFSSSSQRMGVIIRKLNGRHFEYYCKGSPEMLLNFIEPNTIPSNFHEILESFTQKGYRVIALAHKELKLSYTKVQKVQRDVIEKDLTFLGLIVLENRLKTDTTPCIRALNDASIRVIMVTGDNILTALSVAKECEIITKGQSVITVNSTNNHPPELFYTLTNTGVTASKTIPASILTPSATNNSILSNSASVVSLDTIESQLQSVTTTTTINNNCTDENYLKKLSQLRRPQGLFNNYRFAISGKVWDIVKEYHPELLPKLVTRGTVFARMSPEQKQQMVHELQNLGYCVAMCGDGANDCGALKAAHTGISLSEAESSVASPFTSKNPNITCVLNIIKEGRAALVTSFGLFKYMAAYSLCQFVSVLILYSIDSNLTDFEFLYIDLFIISIFAFFFGKNEAYSGKLVKETPLNSLISLSPILSLLLQMLLVISFQLVAFEHLKFQPWYEPFNSSKLLDKDDVGCVENYTIFTVSSFQYIILAIVFSKGKPYRNSIFTNYGFIISAILMILFSIYLTLYPAAILQDYFQLILPKDFKFRLYLLGYGSINLIASIFIEYVIIDNWVFKRLRFKFHNIYKSKRKYLAIENEINLDSKWPVLTSDYHSAASPLTQLESREPIPADTENRLSQQTCYAEIVIEKEKFDKNHVLNKLYETATSDSKSSDNKIDLLSSCSSDTFQSLNNNLMISDDGGNTSYDLANSNNNIADLPFDDNNLKNCVLDFNSTTINYTPIKRNENNCNGGGSNSSNCRDFEMNNLDNNSFR